MKYQTKHENLTYLALWGMLFAAPVLSLYVRMASETDASFNWQELLMVWRQFALFLLIFLFHNYLLAPLLVFRQRRTQYFCTVAAVVALFLAYQCSHKPQDIGPKPHPMEHLGERGTHAPDDPMMEPPHHGEQPPFDDNGRPTFKPDQERGRGNPRDEHPPLMLGQQDIITTIMLVLMFGMNIAIKLYFKSRGDQKQLLALEKENLEQQLEYLKYQINPHFFMNTLNNIHALVDIDPEKAKASILELSKMMRFVLYEGDKQGVPLQREFDFIQNYVTLMRLRYTDRVRIEIALPTEVPNRMLPPLMLITFIENAFKHGVSYQQESFINVAITIGQDRLHFTCINSKTQQEKTSTEHGGVGLQNVKQRLQLLYGKSYALNINDMSDTYGVELSIPLEKEASL